MPIIRDLFSEQELSRYEVISSWGGYPIIAPEVPQLDTLPDYSRYTREVQREAETAKERRLRKLRQRLGQKTGRKL